MKFKLYSPDGASNSEKELKEWPVLEGTKGVQALRQYILAVFNNKRQGTVSTKTRAEVSGTGKKPFRQKGTGMARQGSKRTVIWRTGGVVFGPKPRDYSQKVNKKVKALAFQRALFERANDGKIDLIEKFEASEPKTKQVTSLLSKIKPEGKILIVDDAFEQNTVLASRNIERVTMCQSASLNALDLIHSHHILMTERGADTVIARLKGASS